MEPKRILVFGATGMLGRRVVEALTGNDVTGLTSADCDIADSEAVMATVRKTAPDIIVNCAAYTAVDKAESEPEAADRVNRIGPQNLAMAAKETGSLLIHISTDYVFDGTAATPYTEEMPTAPLGTYGRTKLAGEEAVAASGCKHVIIRTQWLYDSAGKNFFLTMLRLMGERESIGVVNDQTGSPTYAVDLARAIALVADRYDGQDGIYHYSNAGECTWYDFAMSIAQLRLAQTRVSPITTDQYPTPARRPRYSTLSKERMAATFGIDAPHWRSGLERCYYSWLTPFSTNSAPNKTHQMEPPYSKEDNEAAWTAWQCLTQTGINIFLTGNAGTGKTTFLKRLRESGMKNMVITAPTGVAAINANGVTLHSFFQLPIGTFVPGATPPTDRKIRREKQNVMRSMDLLVIDEVSMVRADTLDLVDARLREQRRDERPFGGVQLLLIGDLMQLAPVVRPEDDEILRDYYPNYYFFSSRALQQTQFYTIGLKKIYRQSDSSFIELLNRVRTATMTPRDLATLNQRYIPNFRPAEKEGYIRMTTHIKAAEDINDENLRRLNGNIKVYESRVSNEFPEKSYPTDTAVGLKKGAQVMFIKNDTQEPRRYYNGMIAKVTGLGEDTVDVETQTGESITVGYATWENVKYEVSEQTGQTEPKVVGTFSQIPLALAWAITIHKSQGLTFDKAIIDASRAFSPGQVYVALSRCRTFEGMVLNTPIPMSAIMTDRAIDDFYRSSERGRITPEAIDSFANDHAMSMMRLLFNFNDAYAAIRRICHVFEREYGGRYPNCEDGLNALLRGEIVEMAHVADTFVSKCQTRHDTTGCITSDEDLMGQTRRGCEYFAKRLAELQRKVADVASITPDDAAGRKRLNTLRAELKAAFAVHTAELQAVAAGGFSSSTILKAKAKALSQSSAEEEEAAETVAASEANEVVNKELFLALRDWRRKRAAANPAYTVAPNRTLFDIADMVPTTVQELAKIPGMGKEKMRLYADEILNIVTKFRKKGVKAARTVSLTPKRGAKTIKTEPKPDTRKVSLEAFRRLGSVAAVAKERGFAEETIIKHLMTFVGKGLTTEEVEVLGATLSAASSGS